MAQFDPLIIFPLTFSLLLILVLYYNVAIKIIIPDFFGIKKFREKKSDLPFFYMHFNDNINVNLVHSYKPIFY